MKWGSGSASALLALALACVLCTTTTRTEAYVVPGSFPVDYRQGDHLNVNVNALYSNVTAVTYDFYSLPFCSHEGKARVDESLGEWFLGGRIRGAPFGFDFLKKDELVKLCNKKVDKGGLRKFKDIIDKQYRVRMILDNLPVTRLSVDKFFELAKEYGKDAIFDTVDSTFDYIGYPVGGKENGKYYVNNHLTFSVLYNDAEAKSVTNGFYMGEGMAVESEEDVNTEGRYNIVGFQVLPCSINKDLQMSEAGFDAQDCGAYEKEYIKQGAQDQDISFSYSVYYIKSQVTWSQRWEPFLHVRGKPMHWYSFLDSLLIALLLAILVASILLRTVRGDIARYEQGGEIEREDTGWKLISGDVFRTPPKAGTLCMYVGAGVQVAACLFLSLAFMAFGLISPVKRGALMTWILVTYFLFATVGGYVGTNMFINVTRSKDGWRLLCLRISLFLAGIIIAILTLANIVLGAAKSTQGVPFLYMFFLFLMWILMSVPLTFLGGYFASKKDPIKYPVRTNQIPREIMNRPSSIMAHPLFIVFLSGLLPFGVMYVDLYFIFSAMFEHLYYYAFGFLFGMVFITAIVCIEMSIVSTYMILCIEDYRWWWRSFFAGGSVALYFALYGLSYLIFDSGLEGSLSKFVFMCYLSIMSTIVYLSMGSLSFFISYIFVRNIYGAIKAD
jgi:hypothetical protein